MHAERARPEWEIDDARDCVRHGTYVRIRGLERGKPLEALLRQSGVGSLVILHSTGLVSRRAGMRKMVGALPSSASMWSESDLLSVDSIWWPRGAPIARLV